MKANLTTIRGKRIFAEDFKRLIVKEYDKGRYSVLELSKLYHIDNSVIYRWIYKYSIFNEKSARIVEMKESSSKKVNDLEKKIKELEQAVGQKQLKIDFYEKMMEIAKDEYGIDVKKKLRHPTINWFRENKEVMNSSLSQLYKAIDISKQAVYQYQGRQKVFDQKISNLLIEVEELRSEHPGCGVEKMYDSLKPEFIGRDRFIETFMSLGFRVKKIKNYQRTTIPTSHKYPNLIEGLVVNKENMVWQSDITYFDINGKFYYLVFIIDVYSRKIVGYAISNHLRAEANIRALKMALRDRPAPTIHHSDRGSQYIAKNYVKILNDNGTNISMGLKAQDNAYAERINGIIKNEYLKYKQIKSLNQLKLNVKKSVDHYNKRRIHRSLPNKTSPNKFENQISRTSHQQIIYAADAPSGYRNIVSNNKKNIKNSLYCNLIN